jgi:hypothetical protein
MLTSRPVLSAFVARRHDTGNAFVVFWAQIDGQMGLRQSTKNN